MRAEQLRAALLAVALSGGVAYAAAPASVWQFGTSTFALYGVDQLSEKGEACINNELTLVLRQMINEKLKPAGEPLNINHPMVTGVMNGTSVKIVPITGGRTEYWLPVKPGAQSVIVRRYGMSFEGVTLVDRATLPDLSACLALDAKR